MLELRNLQKSYGDIPVIEIDSLDLAAGIYWIKGKNGCGKTTFLKLLAGLLPFKGTISFNKTDLHNQPLAYRKNMGWAEAEPLYPPSITGAELISLYQRIRQAAEQEVKELINSFGVAGFIKEPTGTYSAGMIKKLSLLLALIGNPSLVLLDEPLITLDERSLPFVCDQIVDIHNKNGTTFIMSSHQQPDTPLLMAGKELILDNGRIQAAI